MTLAMAKVRQPSPFNHDFTRRISEIRSGGDETIVTECPIRTRAFAYMLITRLPPPILRAGEMNVIRILNLFLRPSLIGMKVAFKKSGIISSKRCRHKYRSTISQDHLVSNEISHGSIYEYSHTLPNFYFERMCCYRANSRA